MSLASVATAPVAGRMADRFGGKDILVTGLVLWAVGTGFVLYSARLYYDRSELVTGLVVAGVGLGMTFAPLQTIAMHNVEPRMAGAAAGLINMTRQLGAVVGSAAVGAMLQAQIVSRLPASAEANSIALPQSFRDKFIEGFSHAAAAKGGLQVGIGQTGARLPENIPSSIRPAILQVGERTFYEAYIPAMRLTLLLPVTVLTLAAIAVFFVKRGPGPDDEPVEEDDAAPAAAAD
jgi:MFS family permease